MLKEAADFAKAIGKSALAAIGFGMMVAGSVLGSTLEAGMDAKESTDKLENSGTIGRRSVAIAAIAGMPTSVLFAFGRASIIGVPVVAALGWEGGNLIETGAELELYAISKAEKTSWTTATHQTKPLDEAPSVSVANMAVKSSAPLSLQSTLEVRVGKGPDLKPAPELPLIVPRAGQIYHLPNQAKPMVTPRS